MTKNTLRGARGTARLLFPGAFLWFVGIGGVGMSSLARLSLRYGFRVAGEDRRAGIEAGFTGTGIEVSPEGKGLPDGVSAVIYTAAAPPDHPTFAEAARCGIPLISRSDLLAYFMKDSPIRVTVAGSHGKTTVTAMLDLIFTRAGLSPTTVSGGTLTNGATYRVGSGPAFLVEACEYTNSFLSFSPTHALLLNLEHDHVDFFPVFSSLVASAKTYLSGAETAILPPSLAYLATAGKSLTFSFDGEAGLTARNVRESAAGTRAELVFLGKTVGNLFLPVPGRHNLQNALAACLTAQAVGVPFSVTAEALSSFALPDRRLTLRGTWGGALWYDDYAHHPSEIAASLSALRPLCRGCLTVAFQSHTYSRTKAEESGFASALRLADRVLVLPIYPARETDDLGVSNETLARRIGDAATAIPDFETAAKELKKAARPGDVMVVMGAGDVNAIFNFLGSFGEQA